MRLYIDINYYSSNGECANLTFGDLATSSGPSIRNIAFFFDQLVSPQASLRNIIPHRLVRPAHPRYSVIIRGVLQM